MADVENLLFSSYGWGEPVKWGNTNKVTSAEKCCEGCLNHNPATSKGLTCNGAALLSPAWISNRSPASAPLEGAMWQSCMCS